MYKTLSGILAALAFAAPAHAAVPVQQQLPEAGPLGLVALGLVGVVVAYRLHKRK